MLFQLLLCIGALGQDATEAAFARATAMYVAERRATFIATGMKPIEEAAKERREVRRFRMWVFVPNAIPAMEIEKRRGSVTLSLNWPGRPSARHSLPTSVWRELTALDELVFQQKNLDFERFRERVLSAEVPGSCHGDIADFEAAISGRVRSAGAGECTSALESFNPAKSAAAAIFARVAIATRRGCSIDGATPGNALIRCFPQNPVKPVD